MQIKLECQPGVCHYATV